MTHDEVLKFALDGTDTERQLAREIIEERGERYAIHERLIDALHRIEALEKAASPAPAPISVTSGGGAATGTLIFPNTSQSPPAGCICGRPWHSTYPPPPCPVHGPASTMRVTC